MNNDPGKKRSLATISHSGMKRIMGENIEVRIFSIGGYIKGVLRGWGNTDGTVDIKTETHGEKTVDRGKATIRERFINAGREEDGVEWFYGDGYWILPVGAEATMADEDKTGRQVWCDEKHKWIGSDEAARLVEMASHIVDAGEVKLNPPGDSPDAVGERKYEREREQFSGKFAEAADGFSPTCTIGMSVECRVANPKGGPMTVRALKELDGRKQAMRTEGAETAPGEVVGVMMDRVIQKKDELKIRSTNYNRSKEKLDHAHEEFQYAEVLLAVAIEKAKGGTL